MSDFEKIFGIEERHITKKCIVVPFFDKKMRDVFPSKDFKKGMLYGVSFLGGITLVHSKMGSVFTGDVVLYLDRTPCENLAFFGTCGSTGRLEVGQIVLADECFAEPDFSRLLGGQRQDWFHLEKEASSTPLAKAFLGQCRERAESVSEATCLSASSFFLEDQSLEYFHKRGVDAVDLECCAFLAACRHIRRQAMCLLVVSDVIGQKPFMRPLSDADEERFMRSMKKAGHLLCDFMEKV